MRTTFSNKFKKQYDKFPETIKKKFDERVVLFCLNSRNILLNNHSLYGKWKGFYSINVTGNIRAIYTKQNPNTAHFIAIGSHSELYS